MTGNEPQRAGASSFGRALYYPYFTVRDVNWLKAALLYWDEITYIAPRGYATSDPEESKPASEFMLTLDPAPYTQRAEATFKRHILPLVDRPDQLARAMLKAVTNAVRDNNVLIHPEKITSRLREDLEQRNILRRGTDDYLLLNQGFDALYMICLAKEIALATSRPPVTDAKAYADCEGLLQFDAVPSPERYAAEGPTGSFLMTLGIGLPSPQQLTRVPLARVVEHHRKRQVERRAFRQAIEGIARKASGITDATALSDYLTDQRRTIATQISDYRKSLDEINVGAVESALRVSCPAWLAAGGSIASGLDAAASAALASLGLAIGFIAWWATVRRERRQTIASCPWHYWIETQRELGGV